MAHGGIHIPSDSIGRDCFPAVQLRPRGPEDRVWAADRSLIHISAATLVRMREMCRSKPGSKLVCQWLPAFPAFRLKLGWRRSTPEYSPAARLVQLERARERPTSEFSRSPDRR